MFATKHNYVTICHQIKDTLQSKPMIKRKIFCNQSVALVIRSNVVIEINRGQYFHE